MSKTKKLRALIVSALCAALTLCTGFALGELIPARAADGDVTVTVYAGEGGSVTVGKDTIEAEQNKAITAQTNDVLELTAKPAEGYVFAYWYEGEEEAAAQLSDPLSYDATYSYKVPEANASVHARFFDKSKENAILGNWQSGTQDEYTLTLTGDADYDKQNNEHYKSGANEYLTVEFYGEKWVNVTTSITAELQNGNAPSNYGQLYFVIVDGLKVESYITYKDIGEYNTIFKAYGNTYHRVELQYRAPSYSSKSSYNKKPAPTTWTAKCKLTKMSDEDVANRNGTINQRVKFDSRLGDVYYLEGIPSKSYIKNDYILQHGTRIINNAEETSITVTKNVPVLFYALEKETVTSTLDVSRETIVYNGGVYIDTPGYSVNTTDIFTFTDDSQTVIADFKEVGLLPEITIQTTVNGSAMENRTISSGETVNFNYTDENSIIVMIESFASAKQQKFDISVNGIKQDEPELYQGKYSFGLVGVKETKEISIALNYGDAYYYEAPFNFKIEIDIDGGAQKVVSSASDPITVMNDGERPWFFDPAYNEEGGIYAFSSTIYNDTGERRPEGVASQIGFTFHGKGNFSLEFSIKTIDGYNGTIIGYTTGQKLGKIESGTLTGQGDGFASSTGITTLCHSTGNSFSGISIKIDNTERVKEKGDGWYSLSVPIDTEEETTLWFVHAYGKNVDDEKDRVTIRNVAFYSGESYASWGVQNTKGEDNSTAGSVTVMKGTENATVGAVTPGTVLTFTAKPAEGKSFYGWKLLTGTLNAEGESKLQQDDPQITDSDINWNIEGAKFISYEPTYRHIVGSGYSKIVAVIDTTGTYAVRHGDTFYAPGDIEKAFTAATTAEDKNVIVVDSVTLSGITVPAKVNFVLPFNASGSYYEMGTTTTAKNTISWAGGTYAKPVYTLTLNGANTVNGNFYVGGVIHYPDQSAQGHTSGAYSELKLEGTITVGKGGMMDVYGRVTGKGGITVESGATLKQPFLILDFAGGNNTYGLFNADQTPFKRYAMINIQCKGGYTVEYGGELIGHASLFFSGAITTLDQPFISYENGGTTTLINLKNGAKATAVYTDDRFVAGGGNTENIGHTTITITGGATAGYMDFVGMVQTSGVAFSIPYNYSLVLKSGDYSFDYPYKLMPGASLTVDAGATLDLNSEFYVYDGLVQSAMSGKSYPAADALKAENAHYSTNANFIVNGKLNINANATFLGVIQTTNTDTENPAKIVVKRGATLAGKIVDGATTIYDCNYSEYESSMRLFDKAHKVLTSISVDEDGKAEKDMTFTSTWTSEDTTWGVSEIQCSYEAGNGATHAEGVHNDWQTSTLIAVTGLKGSWKLDHEAHTYDWTITDEEKEDTFFKDANHVTTERVCQEFGCNHTESKTLYKNVGTFENREYKGAAFTAEELFVQLYGDKGAFKSATLSDGKQVLKDADKYTITVTLDDTKGYFVVDGAFKTEATFTFTIDKKAIDVEILDQETTYSGTEPTVSQSEGTGYTVNGLCGGDTLGIIITKDVGAGYKEGGYDLTAKEDTSSQYANKNYTITFKYSHEEGEKKHSTFTIKKATLTVTVSGSSPQGEALKYTIEVKGYVGNEKDLLGENTDEWTEKIEITMPKDFSENSAPANYEIVLSWKAGQEVTLLNYEVKFGEDCKYTIADPVFKDVKFSCDGKSYEPNATIEIVYDGKEHTVTATISEGMQVSYEGGDLTTQKNVGTYELKATVTKGEYRQELSIKLTIKQYDLHVSLLPQEKTYDGQGPAVSSEQNVGWKFAEGYDLFDGDDVKGLGIVLSVNGGTKNVGKYDVTTSKNENGNYNVIFDNNGDKLYTINKKAVTVQITNVTMKYGESVEAHKKADGYDKTPEGVIEGESISVTLNFGAVENKAGEYAITGTADATGYNVNYTIEVKDGKFKIEARTLTVVIEDQTDTYNFEHNYDFDTAKWSVKEGVGDGLAEGEGKDVLNVTLTKPELTNAGEYEIEGSWNNGNYEVTFEGSKETKGKYTVAKQDISDGVGIFFIEVEGSDDDLAEGSDVVYVKFEGTTLTLTGRAVVFEGEETPKTLTVTVSPATIDKVGDFEVTLTVEDQNYTGKAVYTVHATDERGYTTHLIETLETLENLAEGLDADSLKAEDYAALKKINAALKTLSEDEIEMGEEDLAPYFELVDAWNDLADIDEVIETAERVANAPIGTLFASMAALSALAGLAYIIRKGGIL